MPPRDTTARAAGDTKDRELLFVRTFDAPRELVWKAWTEKEHLAQWWGPTGFSTTTHSMEVRPGGVWRFVMHGPDGRDYQNRITYDEIAAPERLVYSHGGGDDVEPVTFQVTVTFEEAGGKTRLTMRMVFPSAAERDRVVATYGAEEGAKQTLGRLAAHLAEMAPGSAAASGGAEAEKFVLTRVFDAPRDLVWKAWTESERLMRWWGPKGSTVKSCKVDLRPGGVMHYCLQVPDLGELWGKFVYREIAAPERMVFVVSFSDAKGGVTRHPMNPGWPLEILSTITLAERGAKTAVTVRWAPHNATEAERKTFKDGKPSMEQGWGGTMDRLAHYLAEA